MPLTIYVDIFENNFPRGKTLIGIDLMHESSSAKSPGTIFHDEIASTWTSGYEQGSFSSRLKAILEILGRHVKPNQCWLDLGCGSGVLTAELIKKGAIVSAVDGSPKMLECASRNLSGVPTERLNFRECDVERLDIFPNSTFDGVLCSSVVEYLEFPERSFHEIARILKPEGVLLVSVPPKGSVVRRLQKLLRHLLLQIGISKFPYLEYSRFELDILEIGEYLSQFDLKILATTKFDPVLPNMTLEYINPALVLIEALVVKGENVN